MRLLPAERVAAVILLAAAGAAFALPTVACAAVPPATADLIISDPLPGYSTIEGKIPNGAIDVATVLRISGYTNDIPEARGNLAGQAHTWRSVTGASAVIIVIDSGDERTAANFLKHGIAGHSKPGTSQFESGLDGAAGFTLTRNGTVVHTVMWQQSKYFITMSTADQQHPQDLIDTRAIAANQAGFMGAFTGTVPATTAVVSTPSNEASSGASVVGRLAGVLFIPGVILFAVLRRTRRTAPPQTWHVGQPAATAFPEPRGRYRRCCRRPCLRLRLAYPSRTDRRRSRPGRTSHRRNDALGAPIRVTS